jgi:hypothetical protein
MKSLEEKVQHLLDLEEIRMLKYRYCHYGDGGWAAQPLTHQGPTADLFTEDGVWDARPLGPLVEGRSAIEKLFEAHTSMPMVYHAVTNPMIEITGNTATGHWHLVGGSIGGDGASSFAFNIYEEDYVRTADGWKIKRMRIIPGRKTTLAEAWSEAKPKPRQDA